MISSLFLPLALGGLADFSSLSRLHTTVFSLTSLAPFAFGAADNVNHVVTDTQECTEPGTCSGDEEANNVGNVSSDPSFDSQPKSEHSKQTEESQPNLILGKTGRSGVRLIYEDELALHTGKGGASPENPIWLSILGKVYDVTAGEDYYGEKQGGYTFYAGRDASPCFSSGNNTPEGAAEDWTKWEDKQLLSILEWARFYQDHETYKYLGLFAGSIWFDEDGEQSELRKEFVQRAVPYEMKMHEEKEKKKAERLAKRLAKKKEKAREEKKKKQK